MNRQPATFARRVWVAAAILAPLGLLLALLWTATDVLLLLFAGILVACFLRGLARGFSQYTRMGIGWSLGITVLLLVSVITLTVWLLAPDVSAQVDDLSRALANSIQQLRADLARYEWGRRILAEVPSVAELAQKGNLLGRLTGVFSSTLGVLANAVLVGFIGLYLAAAPGTYITGLVQLFPKRRRARITKVLDAVGETLRRWLVGRAILMVVNGALTTVGLWLLDIPLALTLGTIAGLLNFIPNIGPILAGVPAVLIAWTLGPMPAIYVLSLYVLLQTLDGYLLTPLVQQRTVSLAPALTISAQVLFGALAGAMGLLLATPLTAATLVLVRKLYVEDVLGDHE
jgi:predicted PurR-regulated permease PerM